MAEPMIGLIAPGAMGAAVGSVLTAVGRRVHHASAGRREQSVSRARPAGLVDADAIAPATAGTIAELVAPNARYVDGGIIGGPPRAGGSTRLYLAGSGAGDIAAVDPGAHAPASTPQTPHRPGRSRGNHERSIP